MPLVEMDPSDLDNANIVAAQEVAGPIDLAWVIDDPIDGPWDELKEAIGPESWKYFVDRIEEALCVFQE